MRKYALFALVPLVFFLDRFTKVLIVSNVDLFGNMEITPFFSIVHVRNTGGAFSLLSRHEYAHYIFTALPVLIACVLVFVILKYTFSPAKTISLCLILAGALGNIYDRFVYGNVVDFLDFHIKSYHWPSFNVADISVSCGIGLWLCAELLMQKREISRS